MGMTIVEKIFANKLKKDKVSAGEDYFVPIDLIMGTDATVPLAAKVFEENGFNRVVNDSKVVFINDHFVPAKDITSAQNCKVMREFAKKYKISNFFEIGRCGVCHVTVPEQGFVVPGDVIVGADSHTCTYGALGAFSTGIGSTDMASAWALGELWFKIPESIKVILTGKLNKCVGGKDIILYLLKILGESGALYKSIEFYGDIISSISISDRLTICNMAIEAGAKNAIIPADEKVKSYLKGKTSREGVCFRADVDAIYSKIIEIDISKINLQIAKPYSPANVTDAKELLGMKVNQIVIGSCTNGRIEDFRLASRIVRGKKICPNVKLIIIPGSQFVLKQMIDEGILLSFIESGAVISPPTCGPCIGGHMGILSDSEVGLYTTNRNFCGRNGHINSKVYLCGPAVAAFSAIKGEIAIS